MSNTSPRIIITELDPDSIKANLIEYLRSQDQFGDYNFEGSGLNILLGILAHNTHYNAFYTNMAANERFMDTALLEDSVKSKAKELGYLPGSRTGAVANVDISIETPNTFTSLSMTIPRYTSFVSSPVDGTNYMFSTTEAVTALRTTRFDTFEFSGVSLTQGKSFQFSFGETNLDTNPNGRYVLPDVGIDTSTISVLVQQSSSNTQSDIYTVADDITELDPTSKVFFLETGAGGTFVLQFGDDVTGKKLQNGNIVIVKYNVSDGELANGAENFSYYKGGGFPASSVVVVSTNSVAAGGAAEPDIETIRFNALRAYARQNRAVTSIDYETMLKQEYPFAESISVWGGEENDPPIYGSIFISLKPRSGFILSETEKTRIIKTILKKKNVVTVSPIIIDPNYIYIRCNMKVNYDVRKTDLTKDEMKQIVRNAIFGYNVNNLGEFNSAFRLSGLFSSVTNSHQSILGCDMGVTIEKREYIDLGVTRSYDIDFGVELARGGLVNRVYSPTAFNIIDSTGVVRIAYLEETPLSSSGISNIEIRAPGINYTSQAEVVITGDAPIGSEALAHPVVVNGQIQSIVLDKIGAGYSFANVAISDTKGYGASAYPVLSALVGELRLVYYLNGEKIVLEENAGTIRYDTGKITISNFSPVSTTGTTVQEFRFIAQSQNDTIQPSKNNIVVIDQNDDQSIMIDLIAE